MAAYLEAALENTQLGQAVGGATTGYTCPSFTHQLLLSPPSEPAAEGRLPASP